MKKKKKHTILGGAKVSSQQLSEWGSLGGRPIKYNSCEEKKKARRAQRAIRMGKEPTVLRSYKSVVEKKTQSIQKGIIIYNDPEAKQFPRASISQCSYCKSESLRQSTDPGKSVSSLSSRSLPNSNYNYHDY